MTTVINNTVLLFDMGGVLIDYPGAGRLLKWMPEGTSEEELNRRWHGSRSIRLFESGKCDEKTFADDMIAELSFQTDRDSFLEEFRLIPGGFLPHATEILDRLKDFPTACFSNTNKLQWERLESEFGLEEHFDKCFLSYRIGLTKPDREAFLYVVEKLGVSPEQICFFDDTDVNVNMAKAVGMNAYRARGTAELETRLRELFPSLV